MNGRHANDGDHNHENMVRHRLLELLGELMDADTTNNTTADTQLLPDAGDAAIIAENTGRDMLAIVHIIQNEHANTEEGAPCYRLDEALEAATEIMRLSSRLADNLRRHQRNKQQTKDDL